MFIVSRDGTDNLALIPSYVAKDETDETEREKDSADSWVKE